MRSYGSVDVSAWDSSRAPKTLALPVGHTHYGGHGGPWQGSRGTGGLAPMAQLCSSSSSPDSREMQRKMGRQTPEGDEREAAGGRMAQSSVGSQMLGSDLLQSQGMDHSPGCGIRSAKSGM